MIIKEIFSKSIDRDIKGVITVGRAQDENIKQELEEYVVTRELQKHFRELFSNYKKGIIGNTTKMGVWISGFFGSGKSHFLKMVSYILKNKKVDGLTAIEYFEKDNKITDPMVLADMKLAAETPSTVILFNIDSASESTGRKDKDAIVSVFLKEFNEKLGFCGAFPYVADLERWLSENGKYELFKERFEETEGDSWENKRYEIDFIQDEIVETLVSIGEMSEEAARNWCEKATNPYRISIERFSKLIKDYLDKQGDNHHIIFLIDEIGQYIGDNRDLMLNLQTVTEDLGKACGGKAWVMVTGQQDIDSITNVKGDDFSKIQGRFDTRLSLSSADVAQVIKKRILDKTETAKSSLGMLFDNKVTVIKNLILFDGAEKKLYSDRKDFSETYPFVPYQFNLLGSVLTAIRRYGASGKHLADGERSMLALFKESAMRLGSEELGALVPFNRFYEPLEKFIDHSHSTVITKAYYNEHINPDKTEDCFAANVLKVLFMIKYVKEINPTVENIVSLMVSHIDEDRIELTDKVEKALKLLVRETLVQKNADRYVFLTNEEQEINRAVNQQPVEINEITIEVSKLIFEGLYAENKYRYPHLKGRYSFGFNKIVDNTPYNQKQSYPLSLKILTPNSDERADSETMRILSGQEACVLVVLPDDSAFIDEIRASIQINKFLKSDVFGSASLYERIKTGKRAELRSHNEQGKLFLEEALKAADIYVNGNIVKTSGRDIASRINEAMGKLAETVYHKLSYIDTPVSESDVRAVLRDDKSQLTLGDTSPEINKQAVLDVKNYIALNSSRHSKTSMKTIVTRFRDKPYGFVEVDVQWIVAKLLKDGEIAFFINNEAVSLASKSVDDMFRYITRKEYLEKLMIEKRIKAGDKQKKAVRTAAKELFHYTIHSDDDDQMMSEFMGRVKNLKGEFEKLEIRYQAQPQYPGRRLIQSGKRLLSEILDMKYTGEFFALIDSRLDDCLDLAEDYEPVKSFFAGEQLKIFDKSLKLIKIYNDSKNFIVDEKLESIAAQIKNILCKENPYSEIYKLPELCDRFRTAYFKVVKAELAPVLEAIEDARERVFEELADKPFKDDFKYRCIEKFAEIKDKAERCSNIAKLKNIKSEADAIKVRLLGEIDGKYRAYLAKKVLEKAREGQDNLQTEIAASNPYVKKRKIISIHSVNRSASWQIESAEDIDRYLSMLKKELEAKLEDDTIISIEF